MDECAGQEGDDKFGQQYSNVFFPGGGKPQVKYTDEDFADAVGISTRDAKRYFESESEVDDVD